MRLPTLRNVRNGDDRMTDDQILKVYNAVISKGGANYNDTIKESFQEFRYLVRKGKPLPPYTAEWYKTYIYTNVPPLAEMTNKNMFLLGFADVLFAMFYPLESGKPTSYNYAMLLRWFDWYNFQLQ